MDKYAFATKTTGILGIAVLGGLLFLSLWFWKERLCITDMAYHTYVIAQTGDFAIQNYRFGAAITQAFPLVAFKLNASLKIAMQLYSASFYLWYLLVFSIIVWKMKNWQLGMSLLCFLTVLVSYSFFWAQSEYPQGIVFLILFLSGLLYPVHHKAWNFFVLPVLLITTLFFHPLIFISLSFGVGYLFLNKHIALGKLVVVLVSAIVILLLKSAFFKTGSYESGKMSGMKNFLLLFPDYLSTKSSHFFFRQLISDYVGYFLLLAFVIAYYFRNRLYTKLVWVVSGMLAYLLLVNVSFPDLEQSTYLQNLHLPLAFMIALPLVFEILPTVKPVVWGTVFFVLFVFRISIIYQSHHFFTNRVSSLQSLLNKSNAQPTNRFWIEDVALTPEVYGETWALSYETLLLSSLSSSDSARTIEMQSVIEQHSFLLDSDNVFINRYHGWDGSTLPAKYFNLKPHKYQKLRP